MPKQRFTTEEIIHKLREADVLSGQGQTVAQVCKQLGVTDKTYFRWRKSHGGLRIDLLEDIAVRNTEFVFVSQSQKEKAIEFLKRHIVISDAKLHVIPNIVWDHQFAVMTH